MLLIPFSLLISFVFVITEKIGTVNEDSFENRIQYLLMTAICIDIERDLKELLDETKYSSKKRSCRWVFVLGKMYDKFYFVEY